MTKSELVAILAARHRFREPHAGMPASAGTAQTTGVVSNQLAAPPGGC